MTKLTYFKDNPDLTLIETDNGLVTKWLRKSQSRLIQYTTYYYPISELDDVFKFFYMVQEPFETAPEVMEAYHKFQSKLDIIKQIKEGQVKDFSFTTPADFTGKLHPEQQEVVAQMLLIRKCLLAMEVGMGKTVVSLFTMLKIHEMTGAKCMIVCEAGQIHKPWLDTIFKFSTLKNILVIDGDADERLRKIAAGKADMNKHWLWMCSYETIRINMPDLPKEWDVLVLDEITKIKNVSTKNAKSLRGLSSKYTFGLSGTPIMNSYNDIYGIFKMLNPYLFTNKENFIERYLKVDYFGNPKGLLPGMEVEMNAKLYPWVRQLIKKDVGKDKPMHILTYPVPLTVAQQQELDEINAQIANGERSAFESGTALRQVCNMVSIVTEPMVIEGEFDKTGKPRVIRTLKYPLLPVDEATNKVQRLRELIHDIVDVKKKKVMVFSFFKEAINILVSEFKKNYKVDIVTGESKKGCAFPNIVDCDTCGRHRTCPNVKNKVFSFVQGKTQILFGSDSLSRAYSMYTCDTIINFDLPWSSGDLVQRMGRIDRDNNPVPEFFVYNIVTLGTIEERIIKIIERKEYESSKVFPKYKVGLSKLSGTIKVERI